MAKIRTRTTQNAFSSGEFSPEFDGRTDNERMFKGASRLENFTIRPIGGARRRPGWRYITTTADQAHRAQLIPFVPRANLGYVLEFTHQKIRFYRNNGQIQGSGELVTNGGFDTDLTGWVGAGTTHWDAGRARFDVNVGAPLTQGSVPVTIGLDYTITFRILVSSVSNYTLKIGSTPFGSELLTVTGLGVGSYSYHVVATTTTLSVQFVYFGSGFGGVDGLIDDVSVRATNPLEVVTPYLYADLAKIRWAPSRDVLYLACEGYQPRKLSRASDVSWVLSVINFRPPPTEEKTVTPAADLTLGALTGTAISVTASAGVFLAGDVDREIKSGVGRAVITATTDASHITVDILDDFTVSPLTSGTWTLGGTPGTTITLNKKEPVEAQVTITAALGCFRSTDVGKYIHVYNGIAKITKFTSSTIVVGSILAKFENTVATSNWTLESESWSATDGYPVDVSFSQEDRLIWARNDRIWGSVQGDYENMSVTTLDDNAIEFGLRGDAEAPEVRGIVGANELQLFTSSAEFTASGGNNNPITPTNIKINSDTNEGSARVRPLRVNGVTLFAGKSGRAIFEFVFNYEPNRFVAPNLSLLAPHLFPQGTQIVEMAYQRTPDSTLWVVRSDGLLLGLAYQRDQNVVGWHRHTSHGDAVESIAIVPHPDGDREQAWLSVARTINGVTLRTIEIMDDTSLFTDVNGLNYGQALLDACLLYSGPATTVVTGLGHLEGESVRSISGGVPAGPFVVTGGQVTGLPSSTLHEVGLFMRPTLTTVRPEIQTPEGTIQMRKKRHARIFARLYQSGSLCVNDRPVNFRLASDDPTLPVPLYTGDIPPGSGSGVMNLGWDRDGRITFTQDDPLPLTIVMLASIMGVGG